MVNIKENEENIKNKEAENIPAVEQSQEFSKESIESVPEIIDGKADDLRKEIEAVVPDNQTEANIQNHLSNTQSFEDDKKIEYLLDLAKKEGVEIAIKTAQKMGNSFVTDRLHDALIERGDYQKFTK